jgi:hypothetical protein
VEKQQVKNNKITTNNETTQPQINNMGNGHDKSSKPVLFASKYSMCNFSTFDTTHVNCQKIYKNQY